MGQDKALLAFAGEPLAVHALRCLGDAGLSTSIAGASADLSSFAPVIADPHPGLGPLAGICAALESSKSRWNVFLPVDLPLLPASLIECLFRHAQITERAFTVASVNAFAQTFPAVIDRGAWPYLKAELDAGRGGALAAFRAAARALGQDLGLIPVEFLLQSGQATHPRAWPAAWWFLNVNTPGDLRRAEMLAARPIA